MASRIRAAAPVVLAAGACAALTVASRRLGYPLGPSTVVRCRSRHLSTTVWIPGVTVKSADLVVARVQRCPVGPHWSVVVPVKVADLTPEDRRAAAAHRDGRLP